MLCIDCLVEDRKEIEAVTVSSGFALCHNHLFTFMSRVHKSNSKSAEFAKEYCDWEASVDRTGTSSI